MHVNTAAIYAKEVIKVQYHDFALDWLDFKRFEVRTSTHEALQIYVQKHLIPNFGCYELSEITPEMCYNYMIADLQQYSHVTVKKHLSVLRQSLNDAVCRGLIERSPMASLRMPRTPERYLERHVFMSVEDAKILLAGLKGEWLYPVVLVTLLYGLRRSEVLGLKWDAVDFRRNTITIRHTVVKFSSVVAADAVKSDHSYRTYDILPEVRQVLQELPRTNEYIFTRDGLLLRPDCLTRAFKRALVRLALPPMRFHDLRHSTASILFDAGWSLEDVREWLGHSDIETTSNIYVHYSRRRKVLVGSSLSSLFAEEDKKRAQQ